MNHAPDRASANSPDHLVIIGAGIVGIATAMHLQRAGTRVTVIDKSGPGEGASFGNGGVLASSSIIPVTVPGLLRKAPRMLMDRDGPLFVQWRHLRTLAPWLVRYLRNCEPAIVRRTAAAMHMLVGDSLADHQALAEGTGAERFVIPADYLFYYRDRRHFEADAFGWEIRCANGIAWDELEGEALRALQPGLDPSIGFGVRLPGHGRIGDPGCYVQTLARHVEAQGGRVLRAEVTDIVRAGGRVTGVRAGGETIDCDGVVIAAGAWSKRLAGRLGLQVPLEAERGYHVELHDPSIMPRAPAMVAAGKFVITPMEGRIRLAGIVEFGHRDAPASRAPFDLLLRNIRAAMPDLRWASVSEWMGARPATTDSLPLIGPVPGVAGAWLGFGHHHVGLTAGPRTGEILARMIHGRPSNLDLSPFDPLRFARTSKTGRSR